MDSEMSTCCCFLPRLLFLVQKTRTRGGLLQGPLDMGTVSYLTLEGHLFLNQFSELSFSLKMQIMRENGSLNGGKMKAFGNYFSEKATNRKSVFGLRRRARIAYEPIPWSAQGDAKIEEQNEHISESHL